jgi:hypothetical protein
MKGAQLDHRFRGGRASTGNQGIAAKLNQDHRSRDALDHIHALIVATSRERSLSRLELRIRCICAPRPWIAEGISYSTWHRRRRKHKQAALVERHAVAA